MCIRDRYTHQWATDWVDPGVKDFSMASVQSIEEKNAANELGYRTYRITDTDDDDLQPDEILCPEITSNATCKACGLCAGNRVQAKNIAIRPI